MFMVRGFCHSAADWVTASGQGEAHLVTPVARVQCSSPLVGSGAKLAKLGKYITPAAYVTRLPNASCIGNEGAIVTSDGLLLTSTIQRFASPVAVSTAWDHPLPSGQESVFDGVLGVMAHHGERNFCHVLADGLPRIWLVRKAGIEPDAWAVPAQPPPWFSDLLDRVGIPAKRRIYVEQDSTVTAKSLIVPDASGFALAVAAWARTALLELFGLDDCGKQGDRRIWVSRELASRRRWIQEKEAWSALKNRGFEVCHFEGQTIDLQYQYIVHSEIIAGPHGAGLAWTLAAPSRRGLLFEVVNTQIVHNDYQAVAAVSGWRFARTSHGDVRMFDGDDYLSDMYIDPDEVIRRLDIALDRWRAEL